MLSELTMKEFLERVASGEPTPGGGSVAALSGALSAALTMMVSRLTIGKTGDETREKRMSELIETAGRLEGRLIRDIDRDADAYGAVMRAYRMPKGTEQERSNRGEAIEYALVEAARVPLLVAEAGLDLLALAGDAVKEGNASAVTDAVTAALLARSAVLAALYNVRINLSSIKDRSWAKGIAEKADELEKRAMEQEAEVLSFARTVMK